MSEKFYRAPAPGVSSWFVFALLFLAHANFVEAVTRTWTAGAGGYWTNGANWSGGVVPGSGDDVVFDNSSSANSTVDVDVVIKTLTVSNYTGSIVFPTNVSADLTISNDFYLGTGATIVSSYSSLTNNVVGGVTNGSGRIITVEGNATILGTISGNGGGFPGGQGPGGSGGGAYGGTYGGKAAINTKAPYGSTNQPTSLGSGGSTTTTAAGGGAFKLIVSNALTLNGTVTAKGTNHTYGGGSGGSIWLIADTFAGNGAIIADGGIATSVHPDWPGGGGGRVAIEYTSSTFTGSVSVAPGAHYNRPSQSGTLWEPKRFIDLQGSETSPANVTITNSYQYYFTNAAPTNYWNLTIINGNWVEFHDGSLHITDLMLTNDATTLSTVLRFDTYLGATDDFDMESLSITGSIHISDKSSLMLPAEGIYNLSGDFDILSTNSIVYAFGNTTVINEQSGGTEAKKHGIGVTINCQNATILGTLSGAGYGFPSQQGPGGHNRGGTYGGMGGINTADPTYGSLTQPTALGSGGYGAGGGAVKLNVSDTLTVSGTVSVAGAYHQYGGGAGGSILLMADTFAGNGTITANGATCSPTGSDRGGGGGGRVAIEYTSSTFSGSVSVAGGAQELKPGQPGTFFLCQSPCLGACSSGCGGMTLDTDFSKDGGTATTTNGVRITRMITTWIRRSRLGRSTLAWSDHSMNIYSNQLDNVTTNDLSGLPENTGYNIYDNDVPVCTITSDVSGNLLFTIDLTNGAHNILVDHPGAQGAIASFF